MKIAILFVVVAIAVAAFIGVGIYKNQPENVAFDALIGTPSEFNARDEVRPVVNMLKQGSLYFGIREAKDASGESVIGDLGAYGKIYFSEDAVMVKNLDVLYNDIWVYGDIYASEDLLYVSDEKILEGTIGIDRKALSLSFQNSIFDYYSNSKYSIEDVSTYNDIMRLMYAIEDTSFEADTEQLLSTVIPDIWEIIVENAEITSGNADVTLQGRKESARVIRMRLDGEAVATVIEEIFLYIKRSNDISFFFQKHNPRLSLALGLDSNENAYDYYLDRLDELDDRLDDICNDAKNKIEDDIEIKIVTPKLQSKLLKLEIEQDGDSVFRVDFGKSGLAKTNEITVQTQEETYYYYVEQNDSEAYESQLIINNRIAAQIYIDKSREKFEVLWHADLFADEIELRGTYKEGTGWFSVELNKIIRSNYTSESTIKCDITFILQENATMPPLIIDYIKPSQITEEQVDAWREKVNN